ncbi:oxidoreductase [Arachidicoccus ginsenosidimutans]|uniref:Iron-chelator utilization protein n=1 Tax=Elizabethkingia anophelis TaxID=1117645 RepID=A0A455ZCQ1_9FLAO|nr:MULTISPECIES: FAD-binding oxidoreductase [Bacteroidota]ANI89757.1 oxidoreductase [Arachidicoccus sp. BS20]DAC74623.1 TPA_exp: iron-chelator utilization protein [Elizabethkingia anophelis]
MPRAPKWLFDTVDLLTTKLPDVTVDETVFLSPSVKKIRMSGVFDKVKLTVGAYIDFRVTETEVRRYTVSNFDKETQSMEFIVHLHGKGCGADYMNALQPGDVLSLNKPSTMIKYYDSSFQQYIIFGDESSLGLAQSFAPVLKQNKHIFQFIFELDEENLKIPEILGLESVIVYPKTGLFKNEEWIKQLPVFPLQNEDHIKFILTGNVKSAQTFRKVIKDTTKSKVYLHGYWLEGKKGL